ncbi:MAG: hypothetical protein ACOYVD_14425 [Bacillota bacterium]
MREPFMQGIISGVIGLIAINIAELLMRLVNLSQTTLWQAGGSVFLSKKALQQPLGVAIGFASHIFVGITLAILIAYYIHYTNGKFPVLKGLAISVAVLFIILGIFFPLRKLNMEMQNNPKDVLSAFIDHTIFGIVAGYSVYKLQKGINFNLFKRKAGFYLIPAEAKKLLLGNKKAKKKKFKKPCKIK